MSTFPLANIRYFLKNIATPHNLLVAVFHCFGVLVKETTVECLGLASISPASLGDGDRFAGRVRANTCHRCGRSCRFRSCCVRWKRLSGSGGSDHLRRGRWEYLGGGGGCRGGGFRGSHLGCACCSCGLSCCKKKG